MQEYIARHYLQEHEDVIMRKYEQDLPIYNSDPVRYLVNYQKSKMFDWTGLMQEDYCIPDDVVFGAFMKQFREHKYPEICDYTRKHRALSEINAQAMRELRQERALPECEIWIGSHTGTLPLEVLKSIQDARGKPLVSSMLKTVIVAYREPSEMCGFAIVEHGLEHILQELFVQPEHRKQGYGCVLLKKTREQFHPLQIHCVSDSESAYFQEHAKRQHVQFIMD
jgi:GNAT superfamily N-acetyltransferase